MFSLLLRAARDCNINSKARSESSEQKTLKETLLRLHGFNNKTKREEPQLESPKGLGQPQDGGEKSSVRMTEPETFLEAMDKDDNSISFKPDSTEVVHLKDDQVHVIDELKMIGKSLEHQIMNLQWWQNIRTSVDKKELARDLAKLRPDQRHKLLDSNLPDSILVNVDENFDEMIETRLAFEDTKTGRLNMMGGLLGVLGAMENFKVKPDHRAANLLLDVRFAPPPPSISR